MAESAFDLIILGGGPAGYNAAERAAHGGLKTAVFEERALGGVCLNEGCIPTKTLLYSAKILDYAHHGEAYGVTVTGASLDHAKVVARKDKVVKTLVSGVAAKMRGAGVTVIPASAKIAGKTASGFAVEADGKTYEAKKLLVCTGSEAVVPPIPGLRDSYAGGLAVTNREILDLKTAPRRIVVVGGGVIGLEMASYFCSIGSEVTVVEMLDKIAGPTEAEISKILQKNYEKKGVKFILGAKVAAVNGKPGDGVVEYEKDGKTDKIVCDLVLVSTGRRARTKDIGLEEIGVQMNRGAIVTDETCRTSVPGIWAAGDVNGKIMLAHTAYREGEAAVNDMLGRKDRVDYRAIPSVIYTNPEVGSVGETVETAKKAGIEAEEVTLSLRYSGRYVAEKQGFD
ncbi:MAG: FAD-dependent oxidoreductase [Clostridia bacterium]|nr:FAD-dependent oxidoreductase [Clostridia bacterium]